MSQHNYAMNLNPWQQAIAYFWYNDEEIFKFTQEDFDKRAKDFADRGVTFVETFSFTHFRLGFYPYWKEINECIRKIVVACHKYGIRVVEHHSSHLTHYLRTNEGWTRVGESMLSYANGKSSDDNWHKTLRFLTADFMIDGKDIRTFVQIDGRTGEPAQNCYGAYSMCFNNPDYRKTYFSYLKDVVATGIDGIMNDDIQFFGERNACTCEHCRKLFKDRTGYTLPDPGHWSDFFDNYDNPVYIAWIKFKFESTTRMYRDLTSLYNRLGVHLLRPNYCSDILKHNPTCYSFERCMDLWDVIEQENCFSAVIKESYMDFYTEAVQRYAAAQRSGVPSMSMFYPDRKDSTYFAWALARSWGQLYSGTCEGFDITAFEKPYREFERKYIRYYTAPMKQTDVSFYFSFKTRDYLDKAFERYTKKTMAGMQAAYASGFCVDMVMEADTLDELCKHKTIIASHIPMLSDEEVSRLSKYVQLGGTLIILGDFAVRREDGSVRSSLETEDLLGCKLLDDVQIPFGNGFVFKSSFKSEYDEYQPTIWVGRKGRSHTPDLAVQSKWELQKAGTGTVLSKLVGKPNVEIACKNDRIVASMYEVEDAFVVHLVNLADTISVQEQVVSHEDLIPNFTENAKKVPEIDLCVRIPNAFTVNKVRLCTPECEEEIAIPFEVQQNSARLSVPAGIFSGYGMVIVE